MKFLVEFEDDDELLGLLIERGSSVEAFAPVDLHPCLPKEELDSTGRSWDPRIHSTTKSKNADGSWRRRWGIPNKFYFDVMEEIAP